MVELAREQVKLRPVENDMEEFDRWCGMYGLKNVVRIDAYPRLIEDYDRQADYLEGLAKALREAKRRRLTLAKASPQELARIASTTENEMHMTHSLMKKELVIDRKNSDANKKN